MHEHSTEPELYTNIIHSALETIQLKIQLETFPHYDIYQDNHKCSWNESDMHNISEGKEVTVYGRQEKDPSKWTYATYVKIESNPVFENGKHALLVKCRRIN